jgi:predicted nucleic acid-binding protein
MRVVDTSAWIEWLTASTTGKTIEKELPDKTSWIVPTIVQLELYKWLMREADEDRADQVIAFTQKCVVMPLDTGLALLAAELHRQHKLATADAIVYATALQENADLLTCDDHFAKLPNVRYIRK